MEVTDVDFDLLAGGINSKCKLDIKIENAFKSNNGLVYNWGRIVHCNGSRIFVDDPGDKGGSMYSCLARLILPVDLSSSNWLDLEGHVLVAVIIEEFGHNREEKSCC